MCRNNNKYYFASFHSLGLGCISGACERRRRFFLSIQRFPNASEEENTQTEPNLDEIEFSVRPVQRPPPSSNVSKNELRVVGA